MGLTGNQRALMYALGGLARGGATRGGYVSRLPQIRIGGIWTGAAGAGRRVLVASLAIQDQLNETPNTCRFTVQGDRPAEGADVVITVGSQSATTRLFGGTILRVQELYLAGNPRAAANIVYQCEAIDYTWTFGWRLVSARYRAQSATTIARDLLARFAPPGGYTDAIADGLPPVDEITFTNTPLMDCYTQLATRIGGYAKVDYARRVWLFLTLPATVLPPPRALTATHPSLETLSYTRDLSQVVTRALVEGGGVTAIAECDPGETRIPVEDTAWYSATGGRLVSGPQRLTYTGLVEAGDGAMASAVGGQTGNTAPLGAPTVTPVPGAGLPGGTYRYGYTWTTTAGESLPSPMAPFNTATAGGPPGAPTATPVGGAGLGIGRYRYAFTWCTATGETIPSPIAEATTGSTTTAAPPGLGALASQAGPGLTAGKTSTYRLTFTTATGETTGGGAAGIAIPAAVAAPTIPIYVATTNSPGKLTPGAVYAVAYCWAADTTDPPVYVTPVGPVSLITAGANGGILCQATQTVATGRVWAVRSVAGQTTPLYYCASANAANSEVLDLGLLTDATLQTKAHPSTVNTWAKAQVAITGIPTGPAGVTGRKLYRTAGGGSSYQFVATIPDNTTTTYLDTKSDGSLGAAIPTTNTTTINTAQVAIAGIAAGPSGVTMRRLYRTAVGGTALYLAATLTNNSTTTLTDALADSGLGAAPPVAGTAVLSQAVLSQIEVGPTLTNGRKIYRTIVNGTALKLLATIANNTGTTLPADTAADTALGAAAPTVDSSGLPSQSGGGAVNAGSTAIPVASPDPFKPEGWASVGHQLVRYHSVSATALTGIPPDGPGSLGVSIPYSTPITVVSQLTGIPATGVGAIVESIKAGDQVNVLAIRDDPAAQSALAAALGPPADGIVERYLQDGRISLTEAISRAYALLEQKSTVLETVRYRVRDTATQSGATITVDLPPPVSVSGTFEIQDVTIAGFLGTSVAPTYEVVASTDRFTFEDWLRRSRPDTTKGT